MGKVKIINHCFLFKGLCKYLMQEFTDIHTRGIVIGHDARHGSYRYGFIAKYVRVSGKSRKTH